MPQQNGVVEKMNRTYIKKAMTMNRDLGRNYGARLY
jgi:hypothetical protein